MSDKYKYGFHDAVDCYAVIDTDKNEIIKYFDEEDDAKSFAENKNKEL